VSGVAVAFALLALAGLAGCERGCARSAIESSKVAQVGRGLSVLAGVDCPDGLARCEASTVSVSRLATVPRSCPGPAAACTCPWDAVGECPNGCVAEGIELVIEAPLATAQLCAAAPDAGAAAVGWTGAVLPATSCDEGDAYRCTAGAVVDCRARAPVGRCVRGCYREGAAVPDDEPTRERAFALLCSR
jgi:hypothetical protein